MPCVLMRSARRLARGVALAGVGLEVAADGDGQALADGDGSQRLPQFLVAVGQRRGFLAGSAVGVDVGARAALRGEQFEVAAGLECGVLAGGQGAASERGVAPSIPSSGDARRR